jgi:hypothetical protein
VAVWGQCRAPPVVRSLSSLRGQSLWRYGAPSILCGLVQVTGTRGRVHVLQRLAFMEYMRDTAALVMPHQTTAHNGAFAPTKPARGGAQET